MTESVTRTDSSGPQLESTWQRRLDALICGECSEDEFMEELSSSRQGGADSAWSIVAMLDQRYRRGQMPAELFRSIEAKIAQRELRALDYGTTIELEIDLPAASAPVLPAAPVAAKAPAPAPAAEIGRVLRNRYVLESRLGSGGMGTVFKALDRFRGDLPQTDRMVAVKILHEKAGGRAEVLANLRREFYNAQALSHPNIVKVFELDRDREVEFFTMEYLEGELLSSVIQHLDPLPMSRARAWSIVLDVAAGLAHAHARNVVHADLKPQNIMIVRSGEIRILDFGASSAVLRPPRSADTAHRNNSSAVTLPYASCELLEGRRADPRDDLFALACVAYELLAGQHPFQRRRSTEARDLGLKATRPQGLTHRQWQALALGLAWRREERSISVEEWIARLHPTLESASRKRTALRAAALAGLLIAGLAVAILVARHVPAKRVIAENTPAEAAAGTARNSVPSDASAGAQIQENAAAPQPAAPDDRETLQQRHIERSGAGAAVPVRAHIDTLSISAASYSIGVGKNFAEIHVRRSSGSAGDASFTWWTEPDSALPDSDYVPQARTIQLLSQRNRMASLFVKLIPNVSRRHPAVFYVVIGEPGNGASLGKVTRTAIVLPPQ